MANLTRRLFMPLLGVILLATLSFTAAADEEPCGATYQLPGDVYREVGDWPTIHHDVSNSGVLPEGMAAPKEFRLKWSALENASVLSSPVVGDDGRIYVTATDENFEGLEGWESGILESRLYALDAASGAIIWQDTRVRLGGMAGAPLLIRSPRGELSIIASGAGWLYAYDENGGLRWSARLGREDVGISAHLSSDGRAIFLGTSEGSVYLMDPATGSEIIPPYLPDDLVNGNTPAMTRDGTVIMVGTHAEDLEDGLAWAVKPDTATGSWETKWTFEDIEGESQTSPTLSRDGDRVYIGDQHASLFTLDVESGELLWRYDFDDLIGSEYLIYASVAASPAGLLGFDLINQPIKMDSRLIEFFQRYGFVLGLITTSPFGSSPFDLDFMPRYVVILKDVGDAAEMVYMENWGTTGGLTYSVGSGRFYFDGIEEGPLPGMESSVVVSLDPTTGEHFTQPLENYCMNNISLANGALIVPVFWGGLMNAPVVTFQGYGLHYYEEAPQ